MTAEESLPIVWIGVVVSSGFVLRAVFWAGRSLAARRWLPAWRTSTQLMGWLPAAGTGLVLGSVVAFGPLENTWRVPQLDPPYAAAIIIPLIAGCHLAFAFSPADEFPLETLVSAPRPLGWLLWERLIVTALPYTVLAVAANSIVLIRFPDSGDGFFLRWLAPMVFFSAVSVMVTLASGQAVFAMTLTIVLWVSLGFLAGGLLSRWPFLWPLHIYLQPEQAISQDVFRLHQVWVILGAFVILARAAGQLGKPERLLASLRT